MSGKDEVRDIIWLMWHGAATKPRIQQFSIEYAPQGFLASVTSHCVSGRCRDVLWIVLLCCLLFTEKAGVRICLGLDNRTWRRLGTLMA